MSPSRRNFFTAPCVHVSTVAGPAPDRHTRFLALRSLPSIAADAIPRRYSSSSLPPSFVSGRFAGFLSSAPRGAGVGV